MIYDTKISGVPIRLGVNDSGRTSDEILGDAVYTFSADLAALLVDKKLAQYNGFGQARESTMRENHEEHNGEPWTEDEPLCLAVDAGIACVALLVSRGEPFAFDVDVSEGSTYWAFHDLGHADEDVLADWEDGLADFPPTESWAEDRANLSGARRAVTAGLDLDEVLGQLAGLRAPFSERFSTESSALEDFLAGGLDFMPKDERPKLAEVTEHVEACAVDVLERDEEATADELVDLAREYLDGDSLPQRRPGLVLAALPEYADAISDVIGRGEAVDIETRAAYALEQAITARVYELGQERDEAREQAANEAEETQDPDAMSYSEFLKVTPEEWAAGQ